MVKSTPIKTRVLAVDPNSPDPAVLREAALALREGRLVVIPTETVYGIAADAGNPEAIARLRTAKDRPDAKPLPVVVADQIDRPARRNSRIAVNRGQAAGQVVPLSCQLIHPQHDVSGPPIVIDVNLLGKIVKSIVEIPEPKGGVSPVLILKPDFEKVVQRIFAAEFPCGITGELAVEIETQSGLGDTIGAERTVQRLIGGPEAFPHSLGAIRRGQHSRGAKPVQIAIQHLAVPAFAAGYREQHRRLRLPLA